jgi:hypothetical protein
LFQRDELITNGNYDLIWKKYCGFLDLEIREFQSIQEALLMHQIDILYNSEFGRNFFHRKPNDVNDFRFLAPFTTFDDYIDYFSPHDTHSLPVKPVSWGYTSGSRGFPKLIPYTDQALKAITRCLIGSIILSCASCRNNVNIGKRSNILCGASDFSCSEYVLSQAAAAQMNARLFPVYNTEIRTNEMSGKSILNQLISRKFDILLGSADELAELTDKVSDELNILNYSYQMLSPGSRWRLLQALVRKYFRGQEILPRDICQLKGIVEYNSNPTLNSDELAHTWGVDPLHIYFASEAGIIATQTWKKNALTFLPSSSFLGNL